jgi:HAMP domain-containing protein
MISYQEQILRQEKYQSAKNLLGFVARVSAFNIKNYSYSALEINANRLQGENEEDVLSVRIFDNQGKKLNPGGIEPSVISVPRRYWLEISEDCIFQSPVAEDEIVGKASIIFSLESIYRTINQMRIFFVVLVVLTILLLDFILAFLLRALVTNPLHKLAEGAGIIAKGNFDIKVDIKTSDELGFLGDAVNTMSAELKQSFNEIAELNASLEKKVEERTAQVRSLLEQQNGDYYLTSLLINPLVNSIIRSEKVKVQLYLNQKKKFKFRKWEAQLGGDICVANSIMLRKKRYTVFANGDAMGKSMQGAGGALVMGVVFNSYVERTVTNLDEQDKNPIVWLQECYNELQSVFEAFDGSMLISTIIGITEDDTGSTYYFNAEHPYLVLFRQGKAVFVEDETTIARKIGTIGFSGVNIRRIDLKPDDMLIMGSDGRDDILLGTDETSGARIINEDETLFLRNVEEGKGDIYHIAEIIKSSGEITDDLSLLSVHYTGTAPQKPKKEMFKPINLDIIAIKDDAGKTTYGKHLDQKLKEAIEFYRQENFDGAIWILNTVKGKYKGRIEDYYIYLLLGHCYAKYGQFLEARAVWNEALSIKPDDETLKENIGIINDILHKK